MSEAGLSKSDEIDRNLAKFLQLLPTLARDNAGKWVLMRNESVMGFYEEAIDAQIAGNNQFDDRIFSIQPVTNEAEELGYL